MLAKALILLIRIYQLTLSKMMGQVCRFEPSCSRYAVKCLEYHGAFRGSWLAAVRLSKCHPFHPGGWDPPPPPRGREDLAEKPPVLLEADPDESRPHGDRCGCEAPRQPAARTPGAPG